MFLRGAGVERMIRPRPATDQRVQGTSCDVVSLQSLCSARNVLWVSPYEYVMFSSFTRSVTVIHSRLVVGGWRRRRRGGRQGLCNRGPKCHPDQPYLFRDR